MCQKQAEAKRNGVINPQNYNFHQFKHGKCLCSQNATNQPKMTLELGNMCPEGLPGPPAVTLTKWFKYEKRLLLRCVHHFKSDFNTCNNMDHMCISDTEINYYHLEGQRGITLKLSGITLELNDLTLKFVISIDIK